MKGYSVLLAIGMFNWYVLDIVTTYFGLQQTGVRETNGFARAVMEQFGILNGMIMTKTLAAVLILLLFYVGVRIAGNRLLVEISRWYMATVVFVVGTYVSVTNYLVLI